MKDMVDLQWALIVVTSLAGAADVGELSEYEDDNASDAGMTGSCIWRLSLSWHESTVERTTGIVVSSGDLFSDGAGLAWPSALSRVRL
ncbi:hypothetical protein B0J18DRAFT_464593 [Chaetomium sp. MPI-SDFR-AT-0129]|nr:hypothetical protein B0J18DRAFT_464593 [Chaetomium sp. MPI-SDFR-AT-0129]